MKIDFNAFNPKIIRYNTPPFTGESPKTDWDNENGKLIEKALLAMAVASAAENKINMPIANDTEHISYDDKSNKVKQPLKQEDLDGTNSEIIFEEMKQAMQSAYNNAKDPDIVNKHAKLYQDAYKNRDLLRGGYSGLSDDEINETIIETSTVDALDILGKGTLEAAFALDSVGFNNF